MIGYSTSFWNDAAQCVGSLLLFSIIFALVGHTQNITAVEDFGVAPASRVKGGLGFNIEPTHEWEFEMAKQIGSTYVRFDCPWVVTEKQNPDNTSGGFSLLPRCEIGLALSRTYRQHPSVNALYGPPYHAIVTAALTADVPAGSYVLPVTALNGSLASVQPFSTEIVSETHAQITKRHSYSGGLIVSTDPAMSQIELASVTSAALRVGTKVIINQLLYPPVMLKKSEDFMKNPSIIAFGRYAQFLAESIQKAGVVGEVGLWNEPNWANDLWDNGGGLFDTWPADLARQPSVRVEIPLYLSSTQPVTGVTYDSGYTEKTGFGSIYIPPNLAKIPSISNAQKTVAVESIHPYGNTPEDHFWYAECVDNLAKTPQNANRVFSECTPVGANPQSNAKYAVLYSKMGQAQGGARHNITETGLCRQCSAGTTEDQITRYDLRQFIGFQGLGISPIMFYRLADGNKDDFGWVSYESHQPLPVFNAMRALMSDVSAISGNSAIPGTCQLPRVTTYKGYFPLATVAFVGNCPETGKADAVLFFTWQRSYPEKRSDSWIHVSSPPGAPVTLTLPDGMKVSSVKDTVSLTRVRYKRVGTQITYLVADNPVEVYLSRKSTRWSAGH
jgi:hypothetical protein